MPDKLDPIAPTRAVEMYLTSRENELSKNSLQNYKYDLAAFTDWCQQEGIDNMNDIAGRTVMDFRMDRAEEVKQVTLRGNLWNLKKFLRFCEKIDAVQAGLNEKVAVPEVSTADEVNETFLTADEADAILEYLKKYEYASFRHAVFYTLWHTGMRSGSLRSLDLGDFDPEGNSLKLRHRPEKGTPLKNKTNGERDVYIKDDLCDVLSDFVDMHRPDCLDDCGREPLFSTGSGRPAKTTLQRNIYTVTRPCHFGAQCPHDRSPDTCEAGDYNTASKCPSSVSPHALRKGAITHMLNLGKPKDVASERMNVSREVLDAHYDRRNKAEQMDTRRRYLEDL